MRDVFRRRAERDRVFLVRTRWRVGLLTHLSPLAGIAVARCAAPDRSTERSREPPLQIPRLLHRRTQYVPLPCSSISRWITSSSSAGGFAPAPPGMPVAGVLVALPLGVCRGDRDVARLDRRHPARGWAEPVAARGTGRCDLGVRRLVAREGPRAGFPVSQNGIRERGFRSRRSLKPPASRPALLSRRPSVSVVVSLRFAVSSPRHRLDVGARRSSPPGRSRWRSMPTTRSRARTGRRKCLAALDEAVETLLDERASAIGYGQIPANLERGTVDPGAMTLPVDDVDLVSRSRERFGSRRVENAERRCARRWRLVPAWRAEPRVLTLGTGVGAASRDGPSFALGRARAHRRPEGGPACTCGGRVISKCRLGSAADLVARSCGA